MDYRGEGSSSSPRGRVIHPTHPALSKERPRRGRAAGHLPGDSRVTRDEEGIQGGVRGRTLQKSPEIHRLPHGRSSKKGAVAGRTSGPPANR